MGITLRRRGWFRAPARCRSEAPTGRTGRRSAARLAMGVSRPSASCWHNAASSGLVSRSRAMPVGDQRSSDAGRRPALQRCRSEAPIGRTGRRSTARLAMRVSRPSASCWHNAVVGAGFALTRDAGRRPALQSGRWFRARRAMPVGGQRSSDAGRRPALLLLAWRWGARGLRPHVGMTLRRRGWFRAHARCRSETGAPGDRRSDRLVRIAD